MNEITNTKQSGRFDEVLLSDCSITSCPHSHTIFELNIVTTNFAELFSSKLVDSNTTTLAMSSNYEDSYTYYYYEDCISVTSNECATVRLFHIDSYYGTFYIVTWDGNEITNIKQSDGFDKLIFGEYSITSCPHNHTLLELDSGFRYSPEELSWDIVDSNNTVLVSRSGYEEKHKYYYYKECIRVLGNECVALRLYDR